MSCVQTLTSTCIAWNIKKIIFLIWYCRWRVCLSFSRSSCALSSSARYPSFHGGILRCSCQGLIGCQRLIGPFGLWRSWQRTAKTLISTRRGRHLLGDCRRLRHRRTRTQPQTEAFEMIKVLQSHRQRAADSPKTSYLQHKTTEIIERSYEKTKSRRQQQRHEVETKNHITSAIEHLARNQTIEQIKKPQNVLHLWFLIW